VDYVGYGDNPGTWPEYRRAFMCDLNAAGVPENTVWELVNARSDRPEALPIVIDWLTHLDERVPPGEDRRTMREGLIRNLITKRAKGDRDVIDLLFRQFEIAPTLSESELEAAGFALAEVCENSDFPRVAELIRSDTEFPTKSVLVRWIGRIKTDEAKNLAVSQLSKPATRIPAMRALVQQRAVGVREAVAAYLQDEHEVFRKEAAKALDKLPPD
jgi:hypothetical protein